MFNLIWPSFTKLDAGHISFDDDDVLGCQVNLQLWPIYTIGRDTAQLSLISSQLGSKFEFRLVLK